MTGIDSLRGQALFDELSKLSKEPKADAALFKPLRKPLQPPIDPYIERGLCMICTTQTCTGCGTTHYAQAEQLFLYRTKKRGGLAEYKGLNEKEAEIHTHLPRFVVYRSIEIPHCIGCFDGEVIEL